MSDPVRKGAVQAGSGNTPLRDDVDWYIDFWALLARIGLGSLTRVKVEGELDDLPKDGPLIIASNHASNADGVLIGGWLMPKLRRRIHWLGKREMTEAPIIGPLARHGGIHGVDRAGADVEAFRLAQRVLDEGHVLMVFPEGTRSADGNLREPKDGLALLALRSRAPILPIGVSGTHRFWPKGDRPHVGGRVVLHVGRPFTLAEILGEDALRDRRTAKRLATEAIMRRIAALLPERQRGAYSKSRQETANNPPAEAEVAGEAAPTGASTDRVR